MMDREEFEKEINELLKTYDNEIQGLKNEWMGVKPEEHDDFFTQVEEILSKHFRAKQAFRQFRENNEESLLDLMKDQVEEACDDLKNSFQGIKDNFGF